MSLWKIAWRSIQQRALSSTLTAISMALGVGLVVAVLVIHGVIEQSFRRGAQGYDMIVGAKGGRLQLVLNTVYHLSQPIQNIPYTYYEEFSTGRFESRVEFAIPICMGDSYRGYRIIGTVPEIFDCLEFYDGNSVRHYEFALGQSFDEDNFFGAVLGATVARKAALKIGDKFKPQHGSSDTGDEDLHEHKEEFTIVGILEPTGSPNDQAIFVNMEGFLLLGGHGYEKYASPQGKEHEEAGAEEDKHEDHAGHDHAEHAHLTRIPDDKKMITAILVSTVRDAPRLAMELPKLVNDDIVAQAVMPARVIDELFEGIIRNVQLVLLVLTVLVVVVAGLGILVSIYNSMNDRRHEIAIMRALGASRSIVMAVILLESILLSLGGGIFGLSMAHGIIGLLSPFIVEQTGVVVGALQFQWTELILVPGLIALATIVGYLPAVVAYRTDVAKSLSTGQ